MRWRHDPRLIRGRSNAHSRPSAALARWSSAVVLHRARRSLPTAAATSWRPSRSSARRRLSASRWPSRRPKATVEMTVDYMPPDRMLQTVSRRPCRASSRPCWSATARLPAPAARSKNCCRSSPSRSSSEVQRAMGTTGKDVGSFECVGKTPVRGQGVSSPIARPTRTPSRNDRRKSSGPHHLRRSSDRDCRPSTSFAAHGGKGDP